MADEATPTPTSEPTPTPAPSEPAPAPAEPAPAEPAEGETPPAAPQADTEDTALGGAGEKPAEGEAPEEGESAKAEVPESYELAVPEGFEKLDDDAIAAATPVFKELGLTNEQANKLVPLVADYAKRVVEQQRTALEGQYLSTKADWAKAAKADPEVGGNNYADSIQAAARALDRLGFPSEKDAENNQTNPLRKMLNQTLAGENVEMIRLLARVGKMIGEDSDFVRSDANPAVKRSDAELFYGTKEKA